MTRKIISLLLVFVMIFSALALTSCGEKKTDEKNDVPKKSDVSEEQEDAVTTEDPNKAIMEYLETYAPEETAESYTEDVTPDKYDFGGYEFKFLNSGPIYSMYVYLDPEMTGDVLDDCCYERNFMAEQYMNIDIVEDTYDYNTLHTYAKTLILAGENVHDVMYIQVRQLTPLISENLFYDLLEIDELNIDRIWWDQPLITRNVINGRLFYATSDLHLMAFECVWAIFFNEDMMTDLGLEAPFDLALSGKWTYDAFKQYCEAAANLNGDESFKFKIGANATYGLSHFDITDYFVYSMGGEYCTRDNDGIYHFSADTDPHFLNAWDMVIDLCGPDNGTTLYATWSGDDPDGFRGVFEAGRALFLLEQLRGATLLREWDGKFGLLPMPKYDENQEEYNSMVGYSVSSFCIPNTNMNLSRTGIIVDYLTYLSYTSLLPRYYDIHVALKALGRQESIDVLSIVRGTRGCEVAVPYGWCTEVNNALRAITQKNEHSVASTVEKYRDSIITSITEMYEAYPDLNHVS